MAVRCEDCEWFDDQSTGLPVCVEHRRYTHREWTCSDGAERGTADGPEEQAEDRAE